MRRKPNRVGGEHTRHPVPVRAPHGGGILLDGAADRRNVTFMQRHGANPEKLIALSAFNGPSRAATTAVPSMRRLRRSCTKAMIFSASRRQSESKWSVARNVRPASGTAATVV